MLRRRLLKETGHDFSKDYFTIVNTSSGSNTIKFKASSSGLTKTISVSTDEGSTWTSKKSTTSGVTLATLSSGAKLLIKGTNTAYANSSEHNYFTSTGAFKVEGNIMSLINGDNFVGQTSLTASYAFKSLFLVCSYLIDASDLILPATTLKGSCYYNMFQSCTSLITAPELPATTLAISCYSRMFFNCTSLTKVPKLPATTLKGSCYYYMFYGCTGLTTIPSDLLPATTMEISCYYSMFHDCSGLTNVPNLPATTLADHCYTSMFHNCRKLTETPVALLPATTLATYCYSNMFLGCEKLTTAPVLPATTLESYCYYCMFYGCTSLRLISCLATNISASNCTSSWTYNVASTGTFKKDSSMTSWTLNSANGIPTGWTVEDYDYIDQYLTITSLEDNNVIRWGKLSSRDSKTIKVSLDYGATWIEKTSNYSSSGYNTVLGTLNNGESMLIKGNNSTNDGNFFRSSLTCNVSGNVNSLIQGDNFYRLGYVQNLYGPDGFTIVTEDDVFAFLFNGCNVINAENLCLPILEITGRGWYEHMFSGCKNLTTAPKLPATTVPDMTYFGMFSLCTSLAEAPSLMAATVIHGQAYSAMFKNCTSLTTAPQVPGDTIESYYDMPYTQMFEGCTSLTYIKCLVQADNGGQHFPFSNWVYNVASTGTFVKHPNATFWTTGTSGIPEGWTVQTATS